MNKCINHKDREAVALYGSFGSGMYVCRECYQYYVKKENENLILAGKSLVIMVIVLILLGFLSIYMGTLI